MNIQMNNIYTEFGVSEKVVLLSTNAEESVNKKFSEIDRIGEFNQLKVLRAMQKNKVSDIHFAATTGYGYNDLGRDTLEQVYADVFKTEAALVRPQLISGTHALTVALFGNLRPGDELLSVVGKPYDTLEGVIGIRETNGSLKEYGISYNQVDLLEDGSVDFNSIPSKINKKTKLVTIQRSKGYDWRPTLSVEIIGKIIKIVKDINPSIICMVDNCYGEFVQTIEPTEVGADLVVGSLIKNPGGGLAPIGGYIAGKEEYVENAAYRLTSPGLGKEVGATLGITQSFYQGLFMSPQIVAGCLKGAVFTAKVFEQLGFTVMPNSIENRYDIIQGIQLGAADKVISFCQGIQKAAPVDSFVVPEPWPMPGYDNDVIMAAGAFVQGSSIELSADAPIKSPYNVFFQGGLSWHHIKIGIMIAVQNMLDQNLIDF